MKLYVALFVGALGVLVLFAGVNGSALKLFGSLFGSAPAGGGSTTGPTAKDPSAPFAKISGTGTAPNTGSGGTGKLAQ